MDIIILALNSKYIHSSLAPWYLKAEVPSANVLEHTINEDIDKVALDIISQRPRLLAISVYIWNITYVENLIKIIKSAIRDIVIVLGGPEVSYNADEVLQKNPCVDYIISGEGEKPFACLCKFLFDGDVSDLPGISYKDRISQPYIGCGTPISPYTEEYFSALNGRIAYFESSRGCPYSCAYCLSGRCEGVRFFDIDYVKENLLKLANSGSKTIKFVDRTFNSHKKRALQLFSFILDNSGTAFPEDVCFHFELSADLIDDETIALLKSAPVGLFQFEIGIQSFFDRTISAIQRKTDSKTLKRRIKELVLMGNSHIHTDLIAGLPFENLENFANSFNQAYSLGADMLQLGFLKILHGTKLEEMVNEYGFCYSDKPPYEVYETPWLSNADIKTLKTVERAVDKIHNSGRFKRTIDLCLPMFESAFIFFLECGKAIEPTQTLDDMTNALFNFLSLKFEQNCAMLRDAFVCDRLATNPSRGLPSALYIHDERLKNVKKRLNSDAFTAEKLHVRRNIAILYGANKAVFADYDKKGTKGEYKLRFIELSKENEEF